MKKFVTPEVAKEYLAHNMLNRHFSRELAEGYADDMLNGRWLPNPNAGIIFDTKGFMIDGQHRCQAIIIANNQDENFKGVEMFVYDGVPSDVRKVIDIGRVRSVADFLAMESHHNGLTAGAAARLILNFVDNAPRINAKRTKPELIEFCTNNPTIFSYASLAHSAGKASRHSALCAVMFLGTRSGDLEEHAQRFGAGIASGAELSMGDPRLTLRAAILNSRGVRGGSARIDWAFAATAIAWNAFIIGQELSTIRVPRTADDTEFACPPILGAPDRGVGVAGMSDVTMKPKALELAGRTARALRMEESAEHRASA